MNTNRIILIFNDINKLYTPKKVDKKCKLKFAF